MDTSSTKREADDRIERMSQSAHKAVDKAAEVASSYAERMSARGDDLMAIPQDWMDTAREYVREKPWQALAIALAAGYLLRVITGRD
jgi:ElaB/YqjD/DUF883 family membrane-anchored ribosome-binding protein